MTDSEDTSRRSVTALVGTSLFFTGVTYASTLNYGAIVGIDTLGISNAHYALLLMTASIVGAVASVLLGFFSDKIRDRRFFVIFCALMGAFGFGLIFIFRSPLAFVIAIGAIMPFGQALFSQSFSFGRSYYNAKAPARAEFMTSILRTIFALAWAIAPPFVGWIATNTVVFNVYGIAACAYLVCAAIYTILLFNPGAKIGMARKADGTSAPLARARIETPVIVGIVGVALVFIATTINNVTVPLLITATLKGNFGELGIFAGLAAAMELPFMIFWGYALRWIRKPTLIVGATLVYAVYLVLLSRATSIFDVLWLQLLNGPATAALLSIPISYLQEAIKGRVGLSTSLLDVVMVVSSLTSAALFGALTSSGPHYPLMLDVAAGVAVAGAIVMFVAHRFIAIRPVAAQ